MREMALIQEMLIKNPLILIEVLLEKNAVLNFSPEEVVILQYLWLAKTKQNMTLSNKQIAEMANIEEANVRKAIMNLIKEKYITLVSSDVEGKITEEYDLSPLINKCFDATIMPIKTSNALQQFVQKVEGEFARKLSPIEIQYIQGWIYDEHISVEVLEEALKESVINGVRNFKYMNSIINNWQTNKQQDNYANKYGMRESFKQSRQKEFSQEEKEIAKFDWESVLNEDE